MKSIAEGLTASTREARDLVRRHGIEWDSYPIWSRTVAGERVQIGFELDLARRRAPHRHSGVVGAVRSVQRDLCVIARALLPGDLGGRAPGRPQVAFHFAPRRGRRGTVVLAIDFISHEPLRPERYIDVHGFMTRRLARLGAVARKSRPPNGGTP